MASITVNSLENHDPKHQTHYLDVYLTNKKLGISRPQVLSLDYNELPWCTYTLFESVRPNWVRPYTSCWRGRNTLPVMFGDAGVLLMVPA